MSTAVAFHTQLASIMEVLANAAVAEICELVDNGYAVLQLEISRSQKENDSLKRRLRLMELKVARASALRTAGMGSSIFASNRARAQLAHPSNELKRTHTGKFGCSLLTSTRLTFTIIAPTRLPYMCKKTTTLFSWNDFR